ncbi:MAG: recombinase family protein [Beijerinckiaceae bacterium]
MADGKFITYLRVSTDRQGKSGLGIEAQRATVAGFLNGGNHSVITEFVEVESGKRNDRPKLAEAFKACRIRGAKLIIAKLDRLSRDAGFLMNLEHAGVDFVCADNPHATRLTIGILAIVADEERRMISARTTAALTAAKARGTKLGGDRGNLAGESARGRALSILARKEMAKRRANDLADILTDVRQGGAVSLRAIATELNARGIPTARGGAWTAVQVMRVNAKIAA